MQYWNQAEDLIVAAQDQALKTKYMQAKIIKNGADPNCWIYGRFQETVDHIISECPELAKTEYGHRQNKAAAFVHWNICRNFDVKVPDKWYEHHQKATILWDLPVHTDREIKANRRDIILKCKDERSCLLINIAIPTDKNISIKVTEKVLKYKDLEIEIKRMWGMKTKTMPVVIGALGVIKKESKKYLDDIPANICLQDLRKTALLGTAHILRKILSIK